MIASDVSIKIVKYFVVRNELIPEERGRVAYDRIDRCIGIPSSEGATLSDVRFRHGELQKPYVSSARIGVNNPQSGCESLTKEAQWGTAQHLTFVACHEPAPSWSATSQYPNQRQEDQGGSIGQLSPPVAFPLVSLTAASSSSAGQRSRRSHARERS